MNAAHGQLATVTAAPAGDVEPPVWGGGNLEGPQHGIVIAHRITGR